MNFMQFQQSRRELVAKYDHDNILIGVGDCDLEKSDTEQWCYIDGIDYYPSEDLESVSFYGKTGLHIEKLCDGSYLLNIEQESMCADLEKLELALYWYACGESYFGEDLQEAEVTRFRVIEECERIDPNGTYRDSHCIAEGLRPMDLYEACRQFVRLTNPDLIQ